jgi:MSHA pilin protein MshA
MFKRNIARGFTLVELIIVMVILGVLSAFLVPRFASFDSNARLSTLNALAGNIRSAMTIVHSQSVVDGTASSASGTATLEGQTINLVYGYPSDAGASPGIISAINNLQGATTSGTAPVVFTIQTNCTVSYYAAASATVPAYITITNSGC